MTPAFTSHPVQLACLLLLIAAAHTDFSRRIIPNPLVITGVVAGLLYHLLDATAAAHGFAVALSGLLVGGLLLWLPYSFSWVGAGDVKLLAMLGVWLGPIAIVQVFICATLFGGLMAAIQTMGVGWLPQRICPPGQKATDACSDLPAAGLPYALAIGGGYVLFLLRGILH
jgi:Flp pilus assembly protein protease CpaA